MVKAWSQVRPTSVLMDLNVMPVHLQRRSDARGVLCKSGKINEETASVMALNLAGQSLAVSQSVREEKCLA